MHTASDKDSSQKKWGFSSRSVDTAQEKTSTIVRDFRNFVSDIEELFKATATLSGDDLAKAKAKLVERISSAKGTLEEMGMTLADRAGKSATYANNYVHEKPWPIIGAGVALGFLVGYMLTHDRERE